MKTLTFLCIFIGLPIWGGYTGDKLFLWALVGMALLLPAVLLCIQELPHAMTVEEWEQEEKKRDK